MLFKGLSGDILLCIWSNGVVIAIESIEIYLFFSRGVF